MNAKGLLLGLAPWVLFSMTAERLGAGAVAYGAALACVASLVLTLRSMSKGTGAALIDIAGVVTFGALAIAAFAGTEAARQNIADYGRGGAAAVLALIMLISALTVPFTEQIARQEVDPRYWGSPVFRAVNRRISLLWAGLIGLMAVSHLVSGVLSAHDDSRPLFNIVLNWVVPVLIVLQGLKASERIAEQGLTPAGNAA